MNLYSEEYAEFAGAEESPEILKTNLSRCGICKVGAIVPKTRSIEKDYLYVYGRNGLRKVIHEESCCNFQVASLSFLFLLPYFTTTI